MYMNNLSTTGLSEDETNINCITNERESDSTICLYENDTNRKSYPQRNNRSKLNYRDMERGMYENIRTSMWNPIASSIRNQQHIQSQNGTQEHEIIDLSMDDDDDVPKSMDNIDQTYLRFVCICKKSWDRSRVMLQCVSCTNWYHGDCIGISKEETKRFELNGNQFICSSCRGKSNLAKRKHFDDSKTRENGILSKSISYDESTKRLKPNTSFQRGSSTDSQINCIVHDCNNLSKSNWVYCSPSCIRRHINDTLQLIQRSKGMDDVDIPTRDDISLYERRTKKTLDKHLIPNIEDLCRWLNQHPSYEIIKSSLREPIQSTTLTRTISSSVQTTKSNVSSTTKTTTTITNRKPKSNKKQLNQPRRLTTTANISNPTDIRSKVPISLYEKILMRLEKNGEKKYIKQDIRTIVNKIEEEMFRVYGKVDNSYKNKFRSLLANITNMNNNFFYKQIVSKALTAKEIVAMKAEDMLPPEEKEKRKGQFEKEVQMIINAEQQKAEEMARRVRMKVTRQGLVDNDALHLPIFNSKEPNLSAEDKEKRKTKQSMETSKPSLEIKPTTVTKSIESNKKTSSVNVPSTTIIKPTNSNESSKGSIVEQTNPNFAEVDLDNDYIEPESPTGLDALIYDEDDNDNDEDLNNTNNISSHSSNENTDVTPLSQPIIRDDYNPTKTNDQTTITTISGSKPIIASPNQWRGVILSSDTKISCQSVHIYGECNYLIGHIPDELTILGRLRLGDLWDYIRESVTVRDVLILTLISSSFTFNDNEIFSQYVDTLRTSGRAAVLSKCTNSSFIRDMYLLAADTKECPSNVLSTLFLPNVFESKQLFLVIIGSGKRINKSIVNHSIENQFVYKPIVLQDLSTTRDPRLARNKDPRLNKMSTTSENNIDTINIKQITDQSSNDDLIKLIADSLERIRQSSTADNIRSIVMSTIEILKTNKRDDLCLDFNNQLRIVMNEWQLKHGDNSILIGTIVIGDNLTEENMDVDDNQDDKNKKSITTSSNSNCTSEFNDIDYRFLDQDTDLPAIAVTIEETNTQQKPRRKSRFSDPIPRTDNDSLKSSELNILNEKDAKTTLTNNIRMPSFQLEDKYINSSLTNKFRSNNSFVSSNTLQSNQINISSNIVLPTNNYIKQKSPSHLIRSTDTLHRFTEQPGMKNRFSSSTNQWRSYNNHNYTTHYHDFDRPQE